ncbi:MAG: hypothetical protein ACQEUZ_04640 [Pseudomonadota bacterium]
MPDIPGSLILTVALGGAVGCGLWRLPFARRPGAVAAVAAGAGGGVAAGFLLPQTGLPVSSTPIIGLTTTVAGAVAAVLALAALGGGPASGEPRLAAFRAVCMAASLLCLLNGALVLASLLLADAAHISRMAVVASAVVAGLFAAAGVLSALVRRRLTDAVDAVARHPAMSEAAAGLRRLLGTMILAGLASDAALLMMTLAIVGRMRQGFAVFG